MPKGNMANVKIQYVKAYTDKTGVRRHYFRRRGHTGGPLPSAPGSPEFMEAYQGYMAVRASGVGKTKGTFGRVIIDYFQTAHFTELKPNSQKLYRSILEGLAKTHGHKPVHLLNEDAIIKIIEGIGKDAPAMANTTKSVLQYVLKIAAKRKWIPREISFDDVKKYKGGTHHTWTQDEMDAFEARWPLGTRQRLIYATLLYTGQRGGDAVRITRREALSGVLTFEQEKTDQEAEDVTTVIPVHPDLMAAIKAGPANGLTLLGNVNGKPMTRRRLTDVMTRAAKQAGLSPRCIPHGLRKAILTRLAESGATDKEIGAVSGHKSLKEIARYTAKASQKKLAISALAKITKPGT